MFTVDVAILNISSHNCFTAFLARLGMQGSAVQLELPIP